jgi:rhodanese-related sulfurtransferase
MTLIFRTALLLSLTLAPRWTLFAADHTKDTVEQIKMAVSSKKAVIVDVREQSEWDDGHIEGAKFIPLSSLKTVNKDELQKLIPAGMIVYLHCGSGKRCLKAADQLSGLGWDLRPLKLGYADLLKEGFMKAK